MKTICSYILSLIAIILTIVAISVALPRMDMSFDYLGFITGILGVLVTVLVAWNIFMIIDFKQEKEKLHQYFDEQKKSAQSVGDKLMATFQNQQNQNSLLEKSIANVYAHMMGLNKGYPLPFRYLFHILGSIVSASQVENYNACNIWIGEIKRTIVTPEQIIMPGICKRQLIEMLMQIHKSDNIQGLVDVIALIAKINIIPDSIS